MENNKKFGTKLLILILVIIVGLQIFYKIEQNIFCDQLFDMEFPDEITVVEKHKVRGKLNGNGNSMDFLACVLVKTNKTKEELELMLKNKDFNPVRKDKEEEYNDVYREVVKVNSVALETELLEHKSVSFEKLENVADFKGYYALIIYDGGYTSYFNIS